MIDINSSKISCTKKIENFLKPIIVYIPLESKMQITYRPLVNIGDYIYKGEVVAINTTIDFPIHSSVSGYLVGIKDMMIDTGKKVPCLVIENDYKEKYKDRVGAKRNISLYNKKEFLYMLNNSGIVGLSGNDYPTILKYTSKNDINYLIVNGIECEPYLSSDNAIMYQKCEELLETIDAMMEILKISKCYIAVKENNDKVINKYLKYINSYPNIKLYGIADAYPSGWERYLVKTIYNVEYNKYPIEKNIVVENVETIYAIYELLKYNRPLTERVITINGDGCANKVNVKVKIGTLASELISSLGGYTKKKKDYLFIAGGPLSGKSLPSDELVITKNLCGITVIPNNIEPPTECIKCGKCIKNCPVNILPVVIMHNVNNQRVLEKLHASKCIECGMCSYVCPAKINVKEFVKKAKENK